MSESPSPIVPRTTNPMKSPSYPQRTHVRERAQLQGVLQACDERIALARSRFDALPAGPQRDSAAFLLSQMDGARDQVAAAARRLPMEVGDLYVEDKHLLDNAVAALNRVIARWEATVGA